MTSGNQDEPKPGGFVTGYNEYTSSRYGERNAESSCSYLLPYLYKLPSDFTFLDVGCGPGSIIVDLASRFPSARFTGIDRGELFVAKAQSLAAERGIPNVEFCVGDVYDLDSENTSIDGTEQKSWDVVHCHQVLSHLAKPIEAARILKSIAKSPGGIVAARDAFLEGLHFYPPLEGIQDYLATIGAVSRANGADPDMGRKLLKLMLDAGWKREQIESTAGVWCYAKQEKKTMWARSMKGITGDKDAEWYRRALKVGCSEERLERMTKDWEQWEAREDAWGCLVNGEVVCWNK